jgi:hypothetical protein
MSTLETASAECARLGRSFGLPAIVLSLAAAGMSVGGSSPASAAQLVFDRGLPTTNLNNAAGASRSNVAWGDGGTTFSMGDNFTLSAPAHYLIDEIRVWVVGGPASPAANAFSLWFGVDAGATTSVSFKTLSSSAALTTYNGIDTYQGSSGTFRDMYEVQFTGLNLFVTEGTYAFGVSGPPGPPGPPDLTTPYLHASNGPLGGVPHMGPDGIVYGFTLAGAMDIGNGYPWASIGGWDKISDINVQVFADVPEPASLAIFGLGLAAFGYARRRRSA